MANTTRATPVGQPLPVTPVREAGGLRFVWADEIVPSYADPGLVDGVLDDQAMTIVYGRSGCGKTAVVVDLACRIAAGMAWRGRATKPGLVVYVAAENSESTRRRIWAWAQQHKAGRLPLVVVQSPMQIGAEAVEALKVLVEAACKASGLPPRLLVIDTLARTMGGDENLAKDMNDYVVGLDRLKEGVCPHVLVVHHTGKDEARGARGSSSLKAAADHEWEVSKDKGASRGSIEMTKVREGDLEGKAYGFELEVRELGLNSLGRQVTTVVAQECDAPEKGAAGSEKVKLALAYVRGEGGRVTKEELREALAPLSAAGTPEAERKALARLVKAAGLRAGPGGYLTLPADTADTGLSGSGQGG